MLYSEEDRIVNQQRKKKAWIAAIAASIPFLAAAIVLFVLRMQIPMTVCTCLFACMLIFMIDMKVTPLAMYGRFLYENATGKTHETTGMLMRIGEPVFDNGVAFVELILNIYADLSEEGERRFLLDASRRAPEEWLGKVMIVESHDTYVLDMKLRGNGEVRA